MFSTEHGDIQSTPLITLNQRGRTTESPTEYSIEFINFAAHCAEPVLDIGAAFGVATIPALAKGATVVAVDIEPEHLNILRSRVPAADLDRLTVKVAKFPDELNFLDGTLAAIHASNLLHFLRGNEIISGIHKMYKWLKPGGKVFTVSGTPYCGNIAAVIPIYEERKRKGVLWPGEFENLQAYSDHYTIKELPGFLHLLDDEVLVDAFRKAGFVIEKAEMYKRANLPSYLSYDGRENVGLIAIKP